MAIGDQILDLTAAHASDAFSDSGDALAAALKKEAGDDSVQPLLRTMLAEEGA